MATETKLKRSTFFTSPRFSVTTTDRSFINDFRSIPDMLHHTVATWPDREAFRQFDYAENRWLSITWRTFYEKVQRWRRAFTAMDLHKGDRVAMLLTNCIDAVTFDEAALANGLVPVPLHAIDTAGSSAYILRDSNAHFLITTSRARWNAIAKAAATEQDGLPDLNLVVFTNEVVTEGSPHDLEGHPVTLLGIEEWLSTGNHVPESALPASPSPDDICGFIYTSGTTGRPKGVMLTHRNIVENVKQINRCFDFSHEDIFLSYLPFSHTFERTVAHYNSLANGSAMAFARSAASIEQDMLTVQPTLMCSVPRVYERIYQRLVHELAEASEEKRHLTDWTKEVGWRRFCLQNDLPVEHSQRENLDDTVWPTLDTDIASKIRALFGGKLRATFAGGASLNNAVAKFFCAMGINILQVYGLTETSPIVSFTRPVGNHPSCVGFPVPDCEVKLGDNDELLVRGPQVMSGYWGKPRETEAAFIDGWFRTGDQADLSDGGRIRIKGRLKEIVVTSTGEKIAPIDIEFAIQEDRLFEQVMVLGDNRPFVTALAVVNEKMWRELCEEMQLPFDDPETMHARDMNRLLVKRIRQACRNFPQYGIPRAVGVMLEPWTVENGLLTPTMKLRRPQILAKNLDLIETLYAGHQNAR